MTQPQHPNFTPAPTDWGAYDVPALWAMVESEQEWANRDQVGAWMRMHDVLVSHQENLQRIAQGVMDQWPPEGSEAARRFLDRLNDMIVSAQQASYAARSNASALNLLTDALLEARSGIDPLHQAWQTANPQRQAQLNQQARAIMTQTDTRVAEHGNQFAIPPDLQPLNKETWNPDPSAQQSPDTSRQVVPSLDESPGVGYKKVRTQASSSGDGAATSIPGVDGVPSPSLALGSSSDPSMYVSTVLSGEPTRAVAGSGPSAEPTPGTQGRAGVQQLTVPRMLSGPSIGPSMDPLNAWSSRFPTAGTDAVAVEEPIRAVPAVQAAGRSPAQGTPTGGEAANEGVIGGGLGAGAFRSQGSRRRQYPADDEWEMPIGVASVIKPAPAPDPKIAFDPGPNVIGGCR